MITATLPTIAEARESYRSRTFQGPQFDTLTVSYNRGTSDKHIIRYSLDHEEARVAKFESIEEARAKWAAVVAKWKGEGYVLVRSRKGLDSGEVWVA